MRIFIFLNHSLPCKVMKKKYIVCKNFKYNQTDITKELKLLDDLLQKMNTEQFISDIFTKFNITNDFKNMIKFSNIQLINQQQITINKIVTFIKSNNYF